MTSNVDAIYAEYPFLKNFAPRLSIRRAKVSRFDEDLFDLPAAVWWGDGYNIFRILLLDQRGDPVARVGEGKWLKFMTRDETVGEALLRIGDLAEKVHYVVVVNSNPMMVYRLPSQIQNAGQWLEKRIESGRAELQSE